MTKPAQTHWDTVYKTKPHDTVSWYRAHLDRSLELIRRSAGDRSAAIIDVDGGESTLVDDLLADGYRDLTVIDISATAIDFARWRVAALPGTPLAPMSTAVARHPVRRGSARSGSAQ